MGCSIRELSRRIGVSDTAINKARAAGRIPPELFGVSESGRPFVIDPDKAAAIVSAVLGQGNISQSEKRGEVTGGAQVDKAKAGKPRIQKLKPDPAAPAEPEFDDPIDQRTGLPHINISRQRQAHFDAIAAQAKAEALSGSYLPRDEVHKTAFETARHVRNSLLLMEDRLADQLAAISDPRKIRSMLREEIRQCLVKLSGEVANGSA